MNSFTRGGDDINKNIGIGLIGALRINIERLKKEDPVISMSTQSRIGLPYNGHSPDDIQKVSFDLQPDVKEKVLLIKLNLEGTAYKDPEEFLVNYLNPVFFSFVEVRPPYVYRKKGVKLKKPVRSEEKFDLTMYVREEYYNDFPDISF